MNRVRVLREHACLCGGIGEIEVETVAAEAPNPDVDWTQLEDCFRCGDPVGVTRLLRIVVRPIQLTNAGSVDNGTIAGG